MLALGLVGGATLCGNSRPRPAALSETGACGRVRFVYAPRGGVKMVEAKVKAEVLNFVRRAGGRRAAIVTAEFTLGASGVRSDLALLADEQLIGIEIKTERDTLRRLPSQMIAYSRYCDHVVLVIAPCHERKLASIDLKGASVWVCASSGIETIRDGQPNTVAPGDHIDLLTAEEKRRFLATEISSRAHFCDVFERRYATASERFWEAVKGRSIKANDVQLLSRFLDKRVAVEQMKREQDERWKRWQDAYSNPLLGLPA